MVFRFEKRLELRRFFKGKLIIKIEDIATRNKLQCPYNIRFSVIWTPDANITAELRRFCY